MSEYRVVTNEFEGCQGNGFLGCFCAGDFCACSLQGEMFCIGCPDCKGHQEPVYVQCANIACTNLHTVEIGDVCPVCELEAKELNND